MSKKYLLRKKLCEDTEYYDKDTIEKYIDYLEEKGRLLKIENLYFDVEAMLRPFVCDTRLCIASPKAKRSRKKSCCVDYAPRLSTRERERIDKILPDLLKRFPRLKDTLEEAEGYYVWDESYDRTVNKNENGHCVFLTTDTGEFGFHGCMIHAFCKEKGLSRYLYEPSACVMFPLFILDVDTDEDTLLVSGHSEEVMTIDEDDDENFVDVGCCKPNKLAKRPLYIEMKETFVHMFGAGAWERLDRALRKR